MGLTLAVEQYLDDVGLTEFYNTNAAAWKKLASETHDFVRGHFPSGAKIRRDDVSKALISYLEVDELLTDFLKDKKLRPHYWFDYFADLIIDRTWAEITTVVKPSTE